jgi:hypothetical protein
MAIKMIIPPDDTPNTDFETVKKKIPVVVNSSGTVEWMSPNIKLTEKEAVFVAAKRKIKGDIPKERYQNIKSAILDGLKQGQIEMRYRGQIGYTIAEIKAVSAALSKFNGWKRK